jgi:Holliday junction DNA helicase RuvA
MIAYLTGRLLFKSPEYVVVDVRGVGYQVALPLSSYYDLPVTETEIGLHIYTHVREDAIHLFGFLTPVEKKLFMLLLEVSGIGPKLALSILSGISAPDLHRALIGEDSRRIQGVPGVGKKTAERVVLELKDRVRKINLEVAFPPPTERGPAEDVWEEVLSALLNLGYPRPQADKALEAVRREANPPGTLEEALRRTLRVLFP